MFLCDLLWIGMVEENHMADLNNSDKTLLGWFVRWGIRSTKRLSLWVFLAVQKKKKISNICTNTY